MDGIGKNLKRIRLLKNLSLKEAGNLLNMTATAISKYEKGEILPDSKKLIDFQDKLICEKCAEKISKAKAE